MQIREWFKAAFLTMLLAIFVICPWSAFSQTCPDGCQCISQATANDKFGEGNYQTCQKDPCGKEQSPTGASVDKYCFKFSCPQGCTCMTEEKAKELGYKPCSDPMVSCGNDQDGKPMYCFSAPTSNPCPQGCRCLTEAQAKELGYNAFCQNQKMECGKDANGYPKFCYQVPTYACPTGCICLSSEEAAIKGLKENCLNAAGRPIICGVIDAEKGLFRYCFKQPLPGRCYYDYGLGMCVGLCPDSTKCQPNTVIRDPKTGKVTFAECHCK